MLLNVTTLYSTSNTWWFTARLRHQNTIFLDNVKLFWFLCFVLFISSDFSESPVTDIYSNCQAILIFPVYSDKMLTSDNLYSSCCKVVFCFFNTFFDTENHRSHPDSAVLFDRCFITFISIFFSITLPNSFRMLKLLIFLYLSGIDAC